jgi:NitT/TauT family transport system permease protein
MGADLTRTVGDATARVLGRTAGADEVAGLDALELHGMQRPPIARRIWSALWPKLLAVGIFLAIWQAVVLAALYPEHILPGPVKVFEDLLKQLQGPNLWSAILTTLRRGLWGFGLALAIGVGIGILVARFAILRAAVGSMITGLQTMPSIAWFPLAIVLFKLSEEAITFVVVLGAAPSIANGLLHGIDHIPPVLTRAGRVLGARGLDMYRHVIIPAAMPSFVGGLKQGWAFAWRSLLAGELLVTIANKASLGQLLSVNRELSNYDGMIAIMLVILAIGILMDALVFGQIERRIRVKRGLVGA